MYCVRKQNKTKVQIIGETEQITAHQEARN